MPRHGLKSKLSSHGFILVDVISFDLPKLYNEPLVCTYIHTDRQTDIHPSIHPSIQTYTDTQIQIHRYTDTQIHRYTHTDITVHDMT